MDANQKQTLRRLAGLNENAEVVGQGRPVYIVMEEDRGMGVMPVQAFFDELKANDLANENSHYFMVETTVI